MKGFVAWIWIAIIAIIIAIYNTNQYFKPQQKKTPENTVSLVGEKNGWKVVDDNALIDRGILFRYYKSPTPMKGYGEIGLLCVIEEDRYRMALLIKPVKTLGLDYSTTLLIMLDSSDGRGTGFEGRVSVDDTVITELDGKEISDISSLLNGSESIMVSLLSVDREIIFEVDVKGFDEDNPVLNCI